MRMGFGNNREEPKFLIIGNVTAVTHSELFSYIRDNRIWLGASIHSGDRKFGVPEGYPLNAAGCGIDENGKRFIRVKGVRWFTNLDYPQRHEKLPLYKRYNPNEFPKYDEDDKRAAYERQKGVCPVCQGHFDYGEMEGDHIVPWSRGGKTVPENLQMLCRRCNALKSDKF